MNLNVVFAVFKRNFVSYFSNPTGYLFICVFVLLCAIAAYWPPEFFNANLANLNQLNKYLPYIMLVFIPAITMSIWADERRQGTDELLLTIPASDFDVVVGKYLAAVAIYSAALLFSLVNIVWLWWWGNPDMGLLVANYFGFWMVGVAMLAIGMAASFLTSNLTIGFILGVVFNIPVVFADWFADAILPTSMAMGVKNLSVAEQFRDFGQGVVSFSSVFYFLLITVFMLYVSMLLIGRRHWWGGRDGHSMLGHYLLRALALLAVAIGVNVVFARTAMRIDVTSEQLSSLSPRTKKLLGELKPEHRIFVDAYISPVVPESYVQTRLNVESVLREVSKAAGNNVEVRIHDTEPFSDQAVNAETQFGITPQQVFSRSRGAMNVDQIFMGVAFTSGLNKVVVPFFDRGVPVEYELVRSIATVSQQKRKKMGVLTTDAKLYGGFNMQSMSATPNELIIAELEKQYEVVQVNPESPIAERYDVLLAVQPSSLVPEQMENFLAAVRSGQPTAIFEDPFPLLGDGVPGTAAEKQAPGGMPFMQQPPMPKGDIRPLWTMLGVEFMGEEVVWQDYNPYPKIIDFEQYKEFVFAGAGSGAKQPFNNEAAITSGLQQMLFPFPGSIRRRQASELTFTPLVMTGDATGTLPADKILGFRQLNPELPLLRVPTREQYILAAQIRGKIKADMAMSDEGSDLADASDTPAEDAVAKKDAELNVVLVSDIDVLYSAFFAIRQRGEDPDSEANLNLDNVTFVLNALDTLAGDDRFVEIRKRRRAHRTLTEIEHRIEESKERTDQARKEFREEATEVTKREQAKFDEQMKKLRERKDLDEAAKIQKVALALEVGERRLQAVTEQKERERDRKIRDAERQLARETHSIQSTQKMLAVALAPILPLLMGAVVFFNLRAREREGAPKSRLRSSR